MKKEITDNHDEFIKYRRNIIEPMIYDALKQKYMSTLNEWWITYNPSKETDKTLLLVERRIHPNLEFVIKNALYYGASDGWTLTIVCSDFNFEYLKHITDGKVKLIKLFDGPVGIDPIKERNDYNKLLITREFWDTLIVSEHIITIELDTYFIKHYSLKNFEEYDYMASSWPWKKDEAGGGGLSYRKRSVILKICDLSDNTATMQDCWMSDGVKKLGLRWASANETRFVESYYPWTPIERIIGVHQWWSFIRPFASIEDKLLNF